jgi:hypothetical protein
MDEQDDPVPLFGTWPRIYAAAIVTLVAVMLFIALFSRWPW